MRYGPRAAITALALAAIGANPASGTPAPDNILQAHPALRFDPASRCSDVRPAGPDDEPVAVVLFQVGSTGVPSKATVKASSGAADLDAAATNCVLRLRFQPATRMGDGVAIDSWQQMAWKRARVGAATALPQPQPATATASLAPSAAPAGTASAPGTAQIRVCVDAGGSLTAAPTLTHSSGDAGFDQAALQVARSGSGSYRAVGSPAAPCLQLSLRPEAP